MFGCTSAKQKVSHAISYLEIYACLTALTAVRSPRYCKQVCLLLLALGYVRLRSISFRTTADTVAPRHSKKVSHAQYPIWRYMRACRHSQLFKAPAIANTFASQRLRTTATPFYISPNRGLQKNFCSALGFCVCLHIICSGEVPRGSGSY